MPMHSSLRLRASAICVRQCWRQQSLQKVCPQFIAVASLAATSQKQHWHSSVSAWPAHRQTPTQHLSWSNVSRKQLWHRSTSAWIQELVQGLPSHRAPLTSVSLNVCALCIRLTVMPQVVLGA